MARKAQICKNVEPSQSVCEGKMPPENVTGNSASHFGYGMSAEAEGGAYDADINKACAEYMANFSAGHTNTTKTIDGVVA